MHRGLAGADMVCCGSLILSAVLALAFWTGEGRLGVPMGALALLLLGGSQIMARMVRAEHASQRKLALGRRLLSAAAAALGVAWSGTLFEQLRHAGADDRLLIVAGTIALLALTNRLGPGSRPRSFFAGPLALGTSAGLVAGGLTVSSVSLAALVPFFAIWVCIDGARVEAAADSRTLAALTSADRQETVETLLLDFDESENEWLWRTDAAGVLVATLPDRDAAAAAFACLFLKDAEGPSAAARELRSALKAHRPFRHRLVEVTTEGRSHWFRMSGKPVFDGAGLFLGFRGVVADVTDARNTEARIAYLANYDSLTGVANRANFHALIARECEAAAADGHCRALVCLDLDGFKSVNDGLGHEGGDAILKEASRRLVAAIPAGACVGRLGGDEFAVWLSLTTPAKAEAAAALMIAAVSRPFERDGMQVEIGASAGIAFTPQQTTDPDALLVKADLALYSAKGEGRGRACVFEGRLETSFVERRNLENDLKLAVARGEFELHYQPLVDIADARVVCFEALIRWRSPTRGMVSPADFVPIAEATALIGPIGRWALFEACRAAATWPDDIHVAVNVSPPQVRAPDFVHDVVMALRSSGLSPSRLEIEVTEGVFLDRSPAALQTLTQLRERGIRIALDDFGTGYSSLRYLVDFPVDKIKIDRAFIADLLDSPANQAIVDAIIGIARKLGIRVTAEGIETKAQAQALKLKRCDDLQGFLLSRPRPERDVPEMITAAPAIFRAAVPAHLDSPLALALAGRQRATG